MKELPTLRRGDGKDPNDPTRWDVKTVSTCCTPAASAWAAGSTTPCSAPRWRTRSAPSSGTPA
ncbi:hypothetical protein GCM10023334_088120 [Nonomuraea thailandensis]